MLWSSSLLSGDVHSCSDHLTISLNVQRLSMPRWRRFFSSAGKTTQSLSSYIRDSDVKSQFSESIRCFKLSGGINVSTVHWLMDLQICQPFHCLGHQHDKVQKWKWYCQSLTSTRTPDTACTPNPTESVGFVLTETQHTDTGVIPWFQSDKCLSHSHDLHRHATGRHYIGTAGFLGWSATRACEECPDDPLMAHSRLIRPCSSQHLCTWSFLLG